jgi:hypothetical protein
MNGYTGFSFCTCVEEKDEVLLAKLHIDLSWEDRNERERERERDGLRRDETRRVKKKTDFILSVFYPYSVGEEMRREEDLCHSVIYYPYFLALRDETRTCVITCFTAPVFKS